MWLPAAFAYDQIFNKGQWTKGAVEGAGSALKGIGKGLGLIPQEVPGFQFDPAAAQLPGYDSWRTQLAGGALGAAGRLGPQVNTGPQSEVRSDQTALTRMLMDQALGRGPSIAQAQLQQATDRNLSQAAALGASQASGTRGAGALRQIANQRAAIGQQMVADSSLLRLQEQMQARGLLGQHLGGMRGQDIGLASEQARVGLQTQAMNDDLVKFYTQAGLDLDSAQRAAAMKLQEMMQGEFGQRRDLQYKANQEAAANTMGLLKTMGELGAKAAVGA